jgi:hypothetical protein
MLRSILKATLAVGIFAWLTASSALAQITEGRFSGGTYIYTGAVFPDYEKTKQLFHYDRWFVKNEAQQKIIHTTYTMTNTPLVIQEATIDMNGNLMRYEEQNLQKHYLGFADVSDSTISMTLNTAEKTQSKTVSLKHPVVTGPTLFGFIENNWQTLVTENKGMTIQFVLVERATVMSFDIAFSTLVEGQVGFIMKPESLLMRAFVKPMTIVMDSNTKRVVSYSGPVPQSRLKKNGKLKSFNATTHYTYQP